MTGGQQMLLGSGGLGSFVITAGAAAGGFNGYFGGIAGSVIPTPPLLRGLTLDSLGTGAIGVLQVAIAGPAGTAPSNLFSSVEVRIEGGAVLGNFSSAAATFNGSGNSWTWAVAFMFAVGSQYRFTFT
jgi:hypothetical protein